MKLAKNRSSYLKLSEIPYIRAFLFVLLTFFPSLSMAQWTIETVGSMGELDYTSSTSIGLDSTDNVHIGYYDNTNDNLKYVNTLSGSWASQTPDSTGDVGSGVSIAIDSSDHVHLVYMEQAGSNRNIKYATDKTGAWTTEVIEIISINGYADDIAVAVDSSDNVHVSYSFDYGYGYNVDEGLKYATNATGSWVIEIVYSGQIAYGNSIAVDSSGNAHISFRDIASDALRYATNSSGAWELTTIDGSAWVSGSTSIAIDSFNNVYISYYDTSPDELKYATNKSGSWVTETVDSIGVVGYYSSIVADSSGRPHISYWDATNNNLKYATKIAVLSWSITTVDASGSVGRSTSIAVDSSDGLHISYYDETNGTVKYATNSNITPCADNDGDGYGYGPGSSECVIWRSNNDCDDTEQSIYPGAVDTPYDGIDQDCNGADLTDVDGDGYDSTVVGGSDCNDNDLFAYPGQTWYEDVDGDGYSSGSTIAQCERPAGYKAEAELAATSGDCNDGDSGINPSAIDVPYDGIDQDCSGADLTDVDGDGYDSTVVGGDDCNDDNASISPGMSEIFGNCIDDDCSAATPDTGTTGAGWTIECVDEAGDTGTHTSLATDSSDNVHISYLDISNESIKYASNASGIWTTEAVDTNQYSDYSSFLKLKSTSIAIDSSDNAHIIYCKSCAYQVGNDWDITGELIYATNTSGTWMHETISSSAPYSAGPGESSIAIDSAGMVHFSYANYYAHKGGTFPRYLTYVSGSLGSWTKFTADEGVLNRWTSGIPSIGTGVNNSFAIDASDNIHISHAVNECTLWSGCTIGYTLKYTTNISGTWQTEIIDNTGEVGDYSSIAVDSSGGVHISYFDNTNEDLKYATNESGAWVTETIESAGDVGEYTSIAVDSNGSVHIAYYDSTNGTFSHVTNASLAWVKETLDSGGNV